MITIYEASKNFLGIMCQGVYLSFHSAQVRNTGIDQWETVYAVNKQCRPLDDGLITPEGSCYIVAAEKTRFCIGAAEYICSQISKGVQNENQSRV